MRLQLSLVPVLLLASLLAEPALAQEAAAGDGHATTRILVYDDDDETTVVTSLVDAEATLPGNVTLGAYAVLDAVSSASVDVVSAATGRWTENRVEVGARTSVPLGDTTYSLGAVRSQENDWLSHSASAGASREFFSRNTTVRGGLALTKNRVGRSKDPKFERTLNVQTLELGVDQLLDKATRAGLAYTFQRNAGFQSSPYRYVPASDGSILAERHPEKRQRHALSAYVLHALSERLSARLGYRLYRDDWGLWSHTGSATLAMNVSKKILVAVDARAYNQNKADFYRGSYPTTFRYMSRDRELSSFWNIGGGGQVRMQWGRVSFDAKISAIRYRFRNFPTLPKRIALLMGGGAKVEWQ